MRLGGTADNFSVAKSKEDIKAAAEWAKAHELPIRIIGTGSNIIWRDEGFRGLLVENEITGFEKTSEDHLSATYKIGAGENWDEIVQRTAELGLYGIECLSAIPGTVGATPVQNVGAYGQDISQTLVNLEAYDCDKNDFVTMHGSDCNFGYRTSRFKGIDNSRFLITSVTLKLQRNPPTALWSHSLNEYLDENGIKERDPLTIRNAIIDIRSKKLPDPKVVANTGSFFSNPLIDTETLQKIRVNFPDMPAWDMGPDSHKLSAGWMIEEAGFKGISDPETGMSTWKNHALVIVNENAHSTNDLMKFQQKIKDKVKEMFGIELEQEPELLP